VGTKSTSLLAVLFADIDADLADGDGLARHIAGAALEGLVDGERDLVLERVDLVIELPKVRAPRVLALAVLGHVVWVGVEPGAGVVSVLGDCTGELGAFGSGHDAGGGIGGSM
jgi:hypothetical protein